MRYTFTIFFLLAFGLNLYAADNFYELEAKKIDGEMLQFSSLEGKMLMIVNVASKCGYTYQYGELQQLYETYGGDQFEIIGFPANNFANQEPGSDEEIDEFCKQNYGVTFTMMSKISVVGADMHPVYQWLTQKNKNGVYDSQVQWNFQKYLINADGTLFGVVYTQTSPLAKVVTDWLDESVSVEDEAYANSISIYPNPAENYVIIDNDEPMHNISAGIYDLYGRMLIDLPLLDSDPVNIMGLSPGTYFIIIENGYDIIRKTFIVR